MSEENYLQTMKLSGRKSILEKKNGQSFILNGKQNKFSSCKTEVD